VNGKSKKGGQPRREKQRFRILVPINSTRVSEKRKAEYETSGGGQSGSTVCSQWV